MSKIALDLKKFKHVKSDDKSTTLQHADGHILTMAHNSLSPEFQEQLKCLVKPSDTDESLYSEGGKVKSYIKQFENYKTSHKTTTPQQHLEHSNTYKSKLAEHGHSERTQHDMNRKMRWHNDNSQGSQPKKMADGGMLDAAANWYHKKAKEGTFGSGPQETEKAEQLVNYKKRPEDRSSAAQLKAEGGEVMMAHGGQATPYDQGLPCLNPNCKSHGRPHPNCRCYGRMAEGGKVMNLRYCAHGKGHQSDCEYFKDGGQVEQKRQNPEEMSQMFAEGSPNIITDETPEPSAPVESPVPMGIKADAPESEDHKNQSIEKEVEDAESFINPKQPQMAMSPMKDEDVPLATAQPTPVEPKRDVASEVQQAPTEDTTAQPQPGVGNKSSNPIERFAEHKQQIQKDYSDEDAAWAQDLANGHITPQTYEGLFAKKDTLGKIGTLFGLLVSGAGSGLTHQPNAVIAMMNNEIANDLDAQKTSKANAVNYLRLSQQHEMQKANIGHINAESAILANTAARMRTTRAALQSLVAKAATYPPGSPMRQAADAQLVMLNQFVQNDNNNLADRAAVAGATYRMLGTGGGQPGSPTGGADPDFQQRNRALSSGLVGPAGQEGARWETEHTIPGVEGYSKKPITPEISTKIHNMNVLDNKVRDVIEFAKKHRGVLPGTQAGREALATAREKAEELTNFYNKSTDSLGMTPGRLSWLEEQIKKNPTSLIQYLAGNDATLKEIRDSNVARKNLQLKDLGYPMKSLGKQSQSGENKLEEGRTGTHNGRPTIVKNGKWEYK